MVTFSGTFRHFHLIFTEYTRLFMLTMSISDHNVHFRLKLIMCSDIEVVEYWEPIWFLYGNRFNRSLELRRV